MSKRLLIMAAGTGGHIFPGLAIARTMQERGWQVSWLGTRHGMEQNIVPANGIEMDAISFAGMRGKGLAHMLTGGMKLIAGIASCWNILGRRKPDVVLGMGGYVTVPGGMAARMRKVPLVVVNADARLLLSNQALAPHAKYVLFGFDADFGDAKGKALVTGNPVRSEIIALPPPEQRFAGRSGALKLLVVGGSLGAKVLNDTVPAALAQLATEARPQVVHQTGRQHVGAVKAAYAQKGLEAEVVDFINDMPRRYSEADLVLCRAGAITVSELTAAGVASVLVPFVVSSTSHQRDNARMMAEKFAAVHLPQEMLDADRLASMLKEMTRDKCLELAKAAYALGRRDANDRIADVLAAVAAGAK